MLRKTKDLDSKWQMDAYRIFSVTSTLDNDMLDSSSQKVNK